MSASTHPRAREGANDPAVQAVFDRGLQQQRELLDQLPRLRGPAEASAQALAACLRNGGKVMLCGQGGAAIESQHLAAEFTDFFMRSQTPRAALALSADPTVVVGGQGGPEGHGLHNVFARQVAAIGRPGDCLVAISDSGRSESVVRAVEAALDLDITTIALTGDRGGPLAVGCDHVLAAPSNVPARIQEAHLFIGHTWCALIEELLHDDERTLS